MVLVLIGGCLGNTTKKNQLASDNETNEKKNNNSIHPKGIIIARAYTKEKKTTEKNRDKAAKHKKQTLSTFIEIKNSTVRFLLVS